MIQGKGGKIAIKAKGLGHCHAICRRGRREPPPFSGRIQKAISEPIANALLCSVWDLLPKMQPKNDLVKVKLKRKNRVNKDGTVSRRTELEII